MTYFSVPRHVLYQIEAYTKASQVTYIGDLLTYFWWPSDLLNDSIGVPSHVVYQIEAYKGKSIDLL